MVMMKLPEFKARPKAVALVDTVALCSNNLRPKFCDSPIESSECKALREAGVPYSHDVIIAWRVEVDLCGL